jgi:hypothetical protein
VVFSWYSSLARSQLTTNSHWPCYCTLHVYAVVHFTDSMWSFWVETNLYRWFLIICLYMHCGWRSSYQEGKVGISSTPPYFCAWIYLMFFHVQWFKVRGGCSFSWYWWHGWQSLFKLSFHNGFSWVAIFHLWLSWFFIFLSHYGNKFFLKSYTTDLSQCFNIMNVVRGRRCRGCMVVGHGFTTTYAISAYHHWCCEFESRSGRGVQHYVIKFVSDLRHISGFLWVLRFHRIHQ